MANHHHRRKRVQSRTRRHPHPQRKCRKERKGTPALPAPQPSTTPRATTGRKRFKRTKRIIGSIAPIMSITFWTYKWMQLYNSVGWSGIIDTGQQFFTSIHWPL